MGWLLQPAGSLAEADDLLLEMLYQLRKMHSLLRISVYSELLIPLYQTPSDNSLSR